MTRQTRLLIGLIAMIGACGGSPDGEAFRNGVPRTETVQMDVPAGAGQALTLETTSQALMGEVAEYYKLTRTITGVVNHGARAVGDLVRMVIVHDPTTVTADQAVWGPWEDPLDPVAWRVTVTRVAEHEYQYRFDGRPRTQPTAEFVTVLSGTHSPAVVAGAERERFGAGNFTLDWDARATLPNPNPDEIGKVSYIYSHAGEQAGVTIQAAFRQVKDKDTQQLVDADYLFVRDPAGSGSMDFVYVTPDAAAKVGGRALVRSRWQVTGAGRSDARMKANNGDSVTVSECWNQNYASVYKSTWLGGDNWGLEASCAFPTAEYSILSQ
jgi:hypothetical protein